MHGGTESSNPILHPATISTCEKKNNNTGNIENDIKLKHKTNQKYCTRTVNNAYFLGYKGTFNLDSGVI